MYLPFCPQSDPPVLFFLLRSLPFPSSPLLLDHDPMEPLKGEVQVRAGARGACNATISGAVGGNADLIFFLSGVADSD